MRYKQTRLKLETIVYACNEIQCWSCSGLACLGGLYNVVIVLEIREDTERRESAQVTCR